MQKRPDAYLLRFGEIALKGKNRDMFVDDLVKILKPRIAPYDGKIELKHKKMVVTMDAEPAKVRQVLTRVFGLTGVTPIWRTSHKWEDISELAWSLMKEHVGSDKTLAVKGKRPYKAFSMPSMEMQRELAGVLYDRGLHLKIDLKQPDLTLNFTVEKEGVWLFTESWRGAGGLPVSRFNKHGLLLSGGIDSPVAGNLIQKRSGHLEPIYFHTPPFTVEAAREKVVDLATVLAGFQHHMTLHVVNFTEVMKTLRTECEARLTVILSRRFMMRVAVEILKKAGGKSIITGESLGQVASQTIENISAINEGVPLPVLRPLIGMDKQEIIQKALEIGTYDISIQPYDDCCSLFAPKEPVTRSNLNHIHAQERRLDIEAMVQEALENTEAIEIKPQFG